MNAIRFVKSPVIDGKSDEPEWKNAIGNNNFIQSRPLEGGTPSQITEVKVGYTNHAI